MSLDGAMMTGIAALDANSAAMDIYSSNIANVDTIGYKDVTANFSDVLASVYGDSESSGVMASSTQNITEQGLIQSASSPTDLAVSGNGMFVVSNDATGGSQYYTRVGNFTPDASGNLENANGYYLMGWPVTNGTTNTGSLEPVNISDIAGMAQPTANVTIQANLDSGATIVPTGTGTGQYSVGDMAGSTPSVTPEFSQTVDVYDSQGGSQPLTINYVQTATNTWSYEVEYTGSQPISAPMTGLSPPNTTTIAAGTLTFNSLGQMTGVTNDTLGPNGVTGQGPDTTGISFNIPWSSGGGGTPASNLYDPSNPQGQQINVNVGSIDGTNGITQFDSPSATVNSSVDGLPYGNVTGVTVDSNGYVTAQFSNGLTQNVYQLPLATFADEDGLNAVSGDAYQESLASGNANINAANSGGAGQIQSSALEGSTVDLATEFTNLITTQRAYSAASRIVTTADEMLQTLEQLPST